MLTAAPESPLSKREKDMHFYDVETHLADEFDLCGERSSRRVRINYLLRYRVPLAL